MSSHTLTAADERPGCTPSASLLGRGAALIEVLLAFALVHLAYRSFKHFTDLGKREVASGLNFSPGAAMILFTVTFLLLGRRSFAAYGLTPQGWRYYLTVALLWSLLLVVAAALLLTLSPVRLDPLHPPDVPRAIVCTLGELAFVLLLALFLRKERRPVRAVPPVVSLIVLFGLLTLPLLVAWHVGRPLPDVLFTTLWLFFGAGFGEEVFFRGYAQSRLNEAFGRPWTLLGTRCGPGLIVSSLLFGFIHVLNTVDYFAGRYDFAWLWLGGPFCVGLFYGLLRERSQSVLPGAVMHGLEDVLARIPTLLP